MLKKLSDFLSSKASLFIILTAVVTFFYPQLFAWVKGDTQTIILGIIMLSMGLTLTPQDFKLLAQRPFDILIGAAAQFTIMPLVAFSLSWLFGQVPASAPYSTAMAIGITCASTLLAPVLTPLLVLALAGERVDVDAWGMFRQILIVTIIPVAIGALAGASTAKSMFASFK